MANPIADMNKTAVLAPPPPPQHGGAHLKQETQPRERERNYIYIYIYIYMYIYIYRIGSCRSTPRPSPIFLAAWRTCSSPRESAASGSGVVHVQVGFRPGLPEVDSRNQLFGAIKNSPQWQQVFQGSGGAIHADVAPQGDEVVITKHRVSAFTGTDLEMILRANEIDTLTLLGIATSGVVLSTLLHASDADYKLFVVKDCCTDQDAEVHACLVEKLFPRRATVLTA